MGHGVSARDPFRDERQEGRINRAPQVLHAAVLKAELESDVDDLFAHCPQGVVA